MSKLDSTDKANLEQLINEGRWLSANPLPSPSRVSGPKMPERERSAKWIIDVTKLLNGNQQLYGFAFQQFQQATRRESIDGVTAGTKVLEELLAQFGGSTEDQENC